MDKFIPSKKMTKRNKCPWLNKRVKRLHKRKQRAYNSYRRNSSDENYEKFKEARKNTTKETRKIHRKHIKSVCEGSLKKFYSYVKNLKMDNVGIPALKQDGKLHSENLKKASTLNDQFSSVFTYEISSPPPESESTIQPLQDITVHTEGVTKLLKDLDPSKATGHDEIPARVLKLTAEDIAPALTRIFQHSINTGELPDSWLQANITPLFKKGERTLASNYRPVSLTSICCKVLEHIIHSNVMKHFVKHNLLTDKQHGFRRGHSCESQLILTTQDLAKSLDNKSQVDMAIMDFSKAFDVVPHNRLLSKLKRYGVENKTHKWISNFLKKRTQRVVVSGEQSSWHKVLSGVPQGTVLGPLLFLTYITTSPTTSSPQSVSLLMTVSFIGK